MLTLCLPNVVSLEKQAPSRKQHELGHLEHLFGDVAADAYGIYPCELVTNEKLLQIDSPVMS